METLLDLKKQGTQGNFKIFCILVEEQKQERTLSFTKSTGMKKQRNTNMEQKKEH